MAQLSRAPGRSCRRPGIHSLEAPSQLELQSWCVQHPLLGSMDTAHTYGAQTRIAGKALAHMKIMKFQKSLKTICNSEPFFALHL